MTPRLPLSDSAPSVLQFGEKAANTSACSSGSLTAVNPDPGLEPHRDIDPTTGRIRVISADAWRARQEELTRRFAEIDAEDNTPNDVYDEFMRNLDDERRRQGRPSAFEGCY